MLRQIYLSPVGRIISIVMNAMAALQRPFIAYGYRDRVSGRFRKRVRISSSATLIDRARISLADDVWIGHYCLVDGSGGVTLGQGVQLAPWAGILTHGSQDAIRLCGARYIEIEAALRPGYAVGPVAVGEFSFLAAGAIILPGVTLGRGCRVDAGAIVTRDVADFAIVRGVPARVVGDVRKIDASYWNDERVREMYFDPDAMAAWQAAHAD